MHIYDQCKKYTSINDCIVDHPGEMLLYFKMDSVSVLDLLNVHNYIYKIKLSRGEGGGED